MIFFFTMSMGAYPGYLLRVVFPCMSLSPLSTKKRIEVGRRLLFGDRVSDEGENGKSTHTLLPNNNIYTKNTTHLIHLFFFLSFNKRFSSTSFSFFFLLLHFPFFPTHNMLSSSSFSPPHPPSLDNSPERTMDDANNVQKYKLLKRKLREMMEVFNAQHRCSNINDSLL